MNCFIVKFSSCVSGLQPTGDCGTDEIHNLHDYGLAQPLNLCGWPMGLPSGKTADGRFVRGQLKITSSLWCRLVPQHRSGSKI